MIVPFWANRFAYCLFFATAGLVLTTWGQQKTLMIQCFLPTCVSNDQRIRNSLLYTHKSTHIYESISILARTLTRFSNHPISFMPNLNQCQKQWWMKNFYQKLIMVLWIKFTLNSVCENDIILHCWCLRCFGFLYRLIYIFFVWKL